MVKASKLLDTAVNIARINTNAVSAIENACFAEIRLMLSDKERKHVFATAAYQEYPYAANFLSISEVSFFNETGLWERDRSQEYKVLKEDVNGA